MNDKPPRLSPSWRLILEMLEANGGRGMIYTGHRSASTNLEQETAWCNAVTEHLLRWHGLIRRAQSNRPGYWFEITDEGREALRVGRRPMYGKMENLFLGDLTR